MRACKLIVRAPVGHLTVIEQGYWRFCPDVPFPSTVVGLLQRLYDEKVSTELAYHFTRSNLRHADFVMTRRNTKKADKRDFYVTELYVNPKLVIYLPAEYCKKKPVNSVYMFSPDFPADVEIEQVELKPLREVEDDRVIKCGGTVFYRMVVGSAVIFYGDFNYLSEYTRKQNGVKIAYYYPHGTEKRAGELKKEFEDAYVDGNGLVVFFKP